MTLQQVLAILAARWKTSLLVLLATVGVIVTISLLQPKKYTATASIMLDVRSPDPVAGVVLAGMMSPAYMATQVDLLGSERVARRAIQSLGLNEDPQMREQWRTATKGQGDFEAWLSDALLQSLEIKPSRESNVIGISYSSPDPNFAAAVANAFVRAYIDTSLELRVDPARQYSGFFDNRAKELRDEVEAAQARLSAYQRDKGLIATDERLDVENARLAELSSQLVMLQSMAAESGGRQAQAGSRPDQMAEVLNNPVVANLSADVAREESRLKELTSRLGDSHPQVIEARARLGELHARLDTATKRASGSVNVNNSVNQSRVAQVRNELAAQRAKVLQMNSLRDEAAVLQRDVQNAQRAYDSMTQRATQSGVESQNTQTNISIIKNASAPATASSPNVRRNALAALFVGVLLAIGVALGIEVMDRRLRTASDVLTELKQPLLVVLPIAQSALAGKEPLRVRMMKARVLTGLPRPDAPA